MGGACCDRAYRSYLHRGLDREYSLEALSKMVVQGYRNIMTPNAFTGDHLANEVNRPPSPVMEMLDRMAQSPVTDLGEVLLAHFGHYTHNRIGTYLVQEVESKNIRQLDGPPSRGDLVVEVVRPDTYKWAMVIEVQGPLVTILSKERPEDVDRVRRQVRIDLLRGYADSVPVDQQS